MKTTSTSTASLLSLLSLSSNVLAANVVHFQIARHDPVPHLARRDPLWARGTLQERATIEAQLYNNATGGSYMANVTVGSPGQQISLVIDTGSSDVFVLASTADQCTDPFLQQKYGGCVGGTFDPTSSTSFKDIGEGEFDISYQDNTGSTGDYFTDNFAIAGTTLSDLQMGLALNTTVGVGIMGIGYSAGESTNTIYPGLIDQLVAQKKINTKAYSLYLDDLQESFGSVLFGGVDTKKFVGDLKILDVQPDPQSQSTVLASFIVDLTSVSVTDNDNKTTSVTSDDFSLPVVLDSGTTISYVPPSTLAQILPLLEAVDDRQNSGIIFVDCDWRTTHPDVHLSFGFGGSGGPVINVPISELLRPLQGSFSGLPFDNACSLGLKSAQAPYLLGDTFLRSAYVVYDIEHNQIGLAQTNFESTDSNIVELQADATSLPTLTGQSSGQTQVPTSHKSGTDSSSSTGSAPSSSGSSANPTTGTGTSSSSATTSTAKKGAGVATVPAFDKSILLVLGVSVFFAAAGGLGFMA